RAEPDVVAPHGRLPRPRVECEEHEHRCKAREKQHRDAEPVPADVPHAGSTTSRPFQRSLPARSSTSTTPSASSAQGAAAVTGCTCLWAPCANADGSTNEFAPNNAAK